MNKIEKQYRASEVASVPIVPRYVYGDFWVGITSPNYRCGKTTAAVGLVEKLGFSIVKFAGPLKAMLAGLLENIGYPETAISYMLESGKEEKPIVGVDATVRQLQQTLGTEWGRLLIDENIWVKCAVMEAEKHRRVVFDDMRFVNEYSLIEERKDLSIRIVRPGEKYQAKTNSHASEGGLNDVPMVEIINDGTVEQLKEITAQVVSLAMENRVEELYAKPTGRA